MMADLRKQSLIFVLRNSTINSDGFFFFINPKQKNSSPTKRKAFPTMWFQLPTLNGSKSPPAFAILPMKISTKNRPPKCSEERKNDLKDLDPLQLGKFISRIPDPNCRNCDRGERCHKKKALLCQKGYLPNSLIASPKKWQKLPRYFSGKTPRFRQENALIYVCLIILAEEPVSSNRKDAISQLPYLKPNPLESFFEIKIIPWRKRK